MEMQVHCQHSRLADTDSVIANPRNPNDHSEDQLKRLAKILMLSGWRSPIVVSKRSGFIVKGHARHRAARMAGFEQVPIDEQDYENEAEEWADLVADNRISELSEWNLFKLSDGFQDLEHALLVGELQDIEVTGFSEVELTQLRESIFSPNFNPDFNAEDMTDEEIEKEKQRLAAAFERQMGQPLTEMICPKCGHEFEVDGTGHGKTP